MIERTWERTGLLLSCLGVILMLWFTACSPRQAQRTAPSIPAQTMVPATFQPTATLPSETPFTPTLESTPLQPTSAPPTPDSSPTTSPTPTAPALPIAGIHVLSPHIPRQVAMVVEAGAFWTRFDDFRWDQIEPQRTDPPTYAWATVNETGLKAASEAGLRTIGIVLYTPSWARREPGYACGPIAEAAFERFGQFLLALVSRYSQPPYNVHEWEIGNEPDIALGAVPGSSGYGCWGDPEDPYFGGGYYAAMLKAVYPRIKAADPQARVLVGGLMLDCDPRNPPELAGHPGKKMDCSSSLFIEGILQAGGGAYFDAVSFHAYDYFALQKNQLGVFGNTNWNSLWNSTGPVLTAKALYLRDLLSTYGVPAKQLFNTEVAVLCGSTGRETVCRGENFERTKALYAARANAAALAQGVIANVWYSLDGWRGSGLSNRGLSYQAYTFNTQMLAGAVYISSVEEIPGVQGYAFWRSQELLWMLWAGDGSTARVNLPAAPHAVYDLYGGLLPAVSELEVGIEPIYIEFAP